MRRWLEGQAALAREAEKGKGKRQTRLVVGKDKNGTQIRLKGYKILGDLDALLAKAAAPSSA